MKTVIKILLMCGLTGLLTIAAKAKEPTAIFKQLSGKEDLFMLKADKKLMGAKVEILSKKGYVISEQILKRKKILVDFNDLKSGLYIIRISKGAFVQEFAYTKDPEPLAI